MAIGLKKISLILFSILFLARFALALSPPVPLPFDVGFYYNGQPVKNLAVEITFGTETITRITNDIGRIFVDVGSGSPHFVSAKTSDLRFITLTIKCSGDLCSKSYQLYNLDYPFKDNIILNMQPVEVKPGEPVVQPTCPSCPVTPCQPEKVCPECVCSATSCETCPEPQFNNFYTGIFGLLAGAVAAGTAIYITKGNNKLKIFKNQNGIETVYHQHPAISGYHNPNVVHSDALISHKKGELLPKYIKNNSGMWVYQGG